MMPGKKELSKHAINRLVGWDCYEPFSLRRNGPYPSSLLFRLFPSTSSLYPRPSDSRYHILPSGPADSEIRTFHFVPATNHLFTHLEILPPARAVSSPRKYLLKIPERAILDCYWRAVLFMPARVGQPRALSRAATLSRVVDGATS